MKKLKTLKIIGVGLLALGLTAFYVTRDVSADIEITVKCRGDRTIRCCTVKVNGEVVAKLRGEKGVLTVRQVDGEVKN